MRRAFSRRSNLSRGVRAAIADRSNRDSWRWGPVLSPSRPEKTRQLQAYDEPRSGTNMSHMPWVHAAAIGSAGLYGSQAAQDEDGEAKTDEGVASTHSEPAESSHVSETHSAELTMRIMQQGEKFAALQRAVSRRSAKQVSMILSTVTPEEAAHLMRQTDKDGKTILHHLVDTRDGYERHGFRDDDIVEALETIFDTLSPSTDQIYNWLSARDADGNNIIHKAADFYHEELLETLIKKLPTKQVQALLAEKNNAGQSALHVSLQYGGKRSRHIILQQLGRIQTRQLFASTDNLGRTGLHIAVERLPADETQALLNHFEIDEIRQMILTREMSGKTVLHCVTDALLYDRNTVANLVGALSHEQRQHVMTMVDAQGRTPLQTAADKNELHIVNDMFRAVYAGTEVSSDMVTELFECWLTEYLNGRVRDILSPEVFNTSASHFKRLDERFRGSRLGNKSGIRGNIHADANCQLYIRLDVSNFGLFNHSIETNRHLYQWQILSSLSLAMIRFEEKQFHEVEQLIENVETVLEHMEAQQFDLNDVTLKSEIEAGLSVLKGMLALTNVGEHGDIWNAFETAQDFYDKAIAQTQLPAAYQMRSKLFSLMAQHALLEHQPDKTFEYMHAAHQDHLHILQVTEHPSQLQFAQVKLGELKTKWLQDHLGERLNMSKIIDYGIQYTNILERHDALPVSMEAEALYNLAIFKLELGHINSALGYLKKAIKINYDHLPSKLLRIIIAKEYFADSKHPPTTELSRAVSLDLYSCKHQLEQSPSLLKTADGTLLHKLIARAGIDITSYQFTQDADHDEEHSVAERLSEIEDTLQRTSRVSRLMGYQNEVNLQKLYRCSNFHIRGRSQSSFVTSDANTERAEAEVSVARGMIARGQKQLATSQPYQEIASHVDIWTLIALLQEAKLKQLQQQHKQANVSLKKANIVLNRMCEQDFFENDGTVQHLKSYLAFLKGNLHHVQSRPDSDHALKKALRAYAGAIRHGMGEASDCQPSKEIYWESAAVNTDYAAYVRSQGEYELALSFLHAAYEESQAALNTTVLPVWHDYARVEQAKLILEWWEALANETVLGADSLKRFRAEYHRLATSHRGLTDEAKPEAYLKWAELELASQCPQRAMNCLEKSLVANPNFIPSRVLRIQIILEHFAEDANLMALAKQDVLDSQAFFEQDWATKSPRNQYYQQQISELAERLGLTADAADDAESAERISPTP